MKLLFTILFFHLLILQANCQNSVLKRFEGGLQLGTNFHTLKPRELSKGQYPFNEKYKWNLSATYGGFIYFNIHKNVFFETGIQFVSTEFIPVEKKNVHSDKSFYTDDVNGNVYQIDYFELWEHSSRAFQIPLKLHVKFYPKKNLNLDLHIGIFRETSSSFNYKLTTSEETNFEVIPEKILKVLRTRYTPTEGIKNPSLIFNKNTEGLEVGTSLNFRNISLNITYNSPFRVYNQSSILYVPMIISNIKYKMF